MPVACVVLPTYNEAANIRILVPLIFQQAAPISTHELHVLVVDDNSPDGTQAVARELMGTHRNLHLLIGEKKDSGKRANEASPAPFKSFMPISSSRWMPISSTILRYFHCL